MVAAPQIFEDCITFGTRNCLQKLLKGSGKQNAARCSAPLREDRAPTPKAAPAAASAAEQSDMGMIMAKCHGILSHLVPAAVQPQSNAVQKDAAGSLTSADEQMHKAGAAYGSTELASSSSGAGRR